MLHLSSIRKIFFGCADRRQMFRMFDRHAQRPNPWQSDTSALYAGEWFEIDAVDHDYMFEILPPLWMRGDMFAMREFLTDSVTSVFFALTIDGQVRHFHGYCDLSDTPSPDRMRVAIVDGESRPVKAMTRTERLDHIWSATHDDYRGYAGERCPEVMRAKRAITVYGGSRGTTLKLLDDLNDKEISAKLPVHLRYLPDAIAA